MTRRVLVTGANSYLGVALITYLSRETDVSITALSSPRAPRHSEPSRVEHLQGDLRVPPSPALRQAFERADAIVHLAWERGSKLKEVSQANTAMLSHLSDAQLATVTFTSSVAAGPDAPSVYGRVKDEVAKRVLSAGGRVLVLGGVIDEPPGGSYAELCESVAKSRLALRFTAPEPRLHLTPLAHALEALRACALAEMSPGLHPCFQAEAVRVNTLMEELEARAPRVRLPTPLWSGALLNIAKSLRYSPAGPLLDRLASFIGRDESWLRALTEGPEG